MNKISHGARFSPLAIKLGELRDLKKYINNSHMSENAKRRLMGEIDCERNQAWRDHYAGIKGYEIFEPHPMRAVTRAMKKKYGMTAIHVQEYDGKVENVHAQNDTMVMLVVPPHDRMKKWLLRVGPAATFDRWANSTSIEREFDNKGCLVDYLLLNKAEIIEKVLASLSKDVEELHNDGYYGA